MQTACGGRLSSTPVHAVLRILETHAIKTLRIRCSHSGRGLNRPRRLLLHHSPTRLPVIPKPPRLPPRSPLKAAQTSKRRPETGISVLRQWLDDAPSVYRPDGDPNDRTVESLRDLWRAHVRNGRADESSTREADASSPGPSASSASTTAPGTSQARPASET